MKRIILALSLALAGWGGAALAAHPALEAARAGAHVVRIAGCCERRGPTFGSIRRTTRTDGGRAPGICQPQPGRGRYGQFAVDRGCLNGERS